jgi:predicted Rossmann fold nucleotide-binding protein DprA/Smf involved in DNA uptake
MIRDGAHIVTELADVLAKLPTHAVVAPPNWSDTGRDVMAPATVAMTWQEGSPSALMELARACRLEPTEALVALLELELAGVVAQRPGMRFVRNS